jgi:predicted RNA binding protein YcfA (HicA-like mRNA interferase family)
MTRLPVVDFKTMEKVLLKLGFQAARQKGNHLFYRHPKEEQRPFPAILDEILPDL